MKVLFGMCVMAYRTGAELFVRDLALDFNRRGHAVVVYAPIMGEMVEELRFQSIACVTSLDSLAEAPDLIIGNTQIETVQCLARFAGVPAISICHDRVAQHGEPPLFSRIGAHVAVDANCAERLTLEHGIDPARVHLIQNGVDIRRFRPRDPLPARPLRAVIFSNYATAGEDTERVRRACEAEGVVLDVVGSGSGNQALAPEAVLPRYDLVFAKARCALEAMAVGCAVIVLNEGQGMAGMVTAENVSEWRRWNFGRRLLVRHAIDVERVREAIRAYRAEDAARVSAWVREQAALEATGLALSTLGETVLSAFRGAGPIPPERESREFADYAAHLLRPPGPAQVAVQVGMLQQEMDAMRGALAEASRAAELARHTMQAPAPEPLPEPVAVPSVDEARLAGLTRELAAARHEITALRGSLSWRVTAPLRRLAGYGLDWWGRWTRH